MTPPQWVAQDFEVLRNAESKSWTRADPNAAMIETTGADAWTVWLRDGSEPHSARLRSDHGRHEGFCDCRGFEFFRRCAHLSVIRKAAFIGATDTHGTPVTIPELSDADDAADRHVEASKGVGPCD